VATKKRKVIKRVKTPNYEVEDYKNPPEDEVLGYRTIKQGAHRIRVAIMKRKGPRGGRTRVTSVWHPKGERRKKR